MIPWQDEAAKRREALKELDSEFEVAVWLLLFMALIFDAWLGK